MQFNEEQWLRDNGLSDIADPSRLYEEIVSRRARGDDGIQAPVSKLHGLFSLPRRGYTIMGAYSGTGKSSFASQWAVSAAANGHRVAVMSLEMPADYTLELMSEQAACLPEPHLPYIERFAAWADQKIFLHSSTDVVSPDEVFRFVETSATLLGCDLIVIDPLMGIDLPSDIDAEKYMATKLASMARDFGVALLIIHHVRKPPSGGLGEKQRPDKAAFLGSTHLTGAAAAVCTLWADPVRREARTNGLEVDDEDGSDYVFTVHKQRFAPWHGSAQLWAHPRARLICNSKARKYQPVDLEEEVCQSESEVIGGSHSDITADILPRSETPVTTSEIVPEMMMNFGASRS